MSRYNLKPTVFRQTDAGELARTGGSPPPEIDLRVLADKVYELMKQELRLERERLGSMNFDRGER